MWKWNYTQIYFPLPSTDFLQEDEAAIKGVFSSCLLEKRVDGTFSQLRQSKSCRTRRAQRELAASLQLSSYYWRTGGNMASRILFTPRSHLVQDPILFGILLNPGLSATPRCQSFWNVSHPTALQACFTPAEESEKWLPATVALRHIRWEWKKKKKKKRKEDEYMWLWHCADFHFLSYFYSLSHPGGTCCPFLAPVNVTLEKKKKWDCRVLTTKSLVFSSV